MAHAIALSVWSGRSSGALKMAMHCVPDEFIDHAAMIDDDPRYALEVSIEQADKLFGTRARRQSRKALDIREQGRDAPPLAAELQAFRCGCDPRHDAGRQMLLEPAP